jgi:oxygen-independent coproporphyrinogen-3 oxidase
MYEVVTGLYVHIPFCPQHCPYCAFAVLTGHRHLYERYVNAVCRELRLWEATCLGPFHTVYIGGGTPSMLTPQQLERIVNTAALVAGIAADAEVTLEANPTTIEAAKFADIRGIGFNRLSLGMQSCSDADLKLLGRFHDATACHDAFRQARRAGFDNISIDLMFSVPGAPRAHWTYSIEHALAWVPEHLSTYSLTIEEGTRFATRRLQGDLAPVSEAEDEWCYAWTMERLERAGYEHYEVSNFARPGYRSRHNWGYWTGSPYIGVGMSAHTYVDGQRQWNVSQVDTYLSLVEANRRPCVGTEFLEGWEKRQEELWLRLRTCDGIQLDARECQTLERADKFEAMRRHGWLRLDRQRLTLTRQGRMLADAIGLEIAALIEPNVG